MQSLTKLRKALCAIGLLSALSSCTDKPLYDKVFADNLNAAYQKLQAPGARIKIETLTRFDWDQLWVFPPYTTVEVIDRALDAPSPEGIKETRIFERDDINLLVFTQNKSVVSVATVPRGTVDLSGTKPQEALTHQTAVFIKSAKQNTLDLMR